MQNHLQNIRIYVNDSCLVNKYLGGDDDDLAVCVGMSDDWESSFFNQPYEKMVMTKTTLFFCEVEKL